MPALLGQPASYGEMLQRVWVSTTIVALACVGSLTFVPSIAEVVGKWPGSATFGPIKDISLAHLLLAFVISTAFRIAKLHDRVSDLLSLRAGFDVSHILAPLARAAGVQVGQDSVAQHRELLMRRTVLMRRTFYAYASFIEPKIPTQLVRSATDGWAWFWCFTEATIVVTLFSAVHLFAQMFLLMGALQVLAICFIAIQVWLYRSTLVPKAAEQVEAIIEDPERKAAVRSVFEEVLSESKCDTAAEGK